jgi:glutathione S-transferase
MTDFIVYSIPGSPFGRSVMAALEEKGASWRLSPVAPGTFRQHPHIARHPFGKVPVLEHDGFQLYETQAILRYLDRILPSPPLTPANTRDAALMDQVIGITDCYLFQGVCSIIAFQRVVGPKLMGTTPDEAAIEGAMPRARIVFDELARLLGSKTFMVGETISLADLHAGPHLSFMEETPEWAELTAAHSNLVDWLARMQARPSFVATTWEGVAALAKAA